MLNILIAFALGAAVLLLGAWWLYNRRPALQEGLDVKDGDVDG